MQSDSERACQQRLALSDTLTDVDGVFPPLHEPVLIWCPLCKWMMGVEHAGDATCETREEGKRKRNFGLINIRVKLWRPLLVRCWYSWQWVIRVGDCRALGQTTEWKTWHMTKNVSNRVFSLIKLNTFLAGWSLLDSVSLWKGSSSKLFDN